MTTDEQAPGEMVLSVICTACPHSEHSGRCSMCTCEKLAPHRHMWVNTNPCACGEPFAALRLVDHVAVGSWSVPAPEETVETTDWRVQRALDDHTQQGHFSLSAGGTSEQYIDLREALMCGFCNRLLVDWYAEQIKDSVPVATGSFGALLLGHFAERGIYGLLWNPKGHGVEWSGELIEETEVVLVDDVVTTGGTLRALKAACEAQSLNVVGEVIAHRTEPPAPEPAGEAEEQCGHWSLMGYPSGHLECADCHVVLREGSAPSDGTPGLTEAHVERWADEDSEIVTFTSWNAGQVDGEEYSFPKAIEAAIAAEARAPLWRMIGELYEANDGLGTRLVAAEARIAAQSALLDERDKWLARAEAAERKLEEMWEALRVAAVMLVAAADVLDERFPDDDAPVMQTDARAFARWVFGGASGNVPLSDEAKGFIAKVERALTPPASTAAEEPTDAG